MREATPAPGPTVPLPIVPSLDRALGDGWTFCADNLAATTVPFLVFYLPAFVISVLLDEKAGDAVEVFLGIIATMGTIRLVLLAASTGAKPTVAGGFIEGFKFFGRAILANLLVVLCFCLVVAGLAVLLYPGWVLQDNGFKIGGSIYLVVAGLPSLWVLFFCALRISMTLPAVADLKVTTAAAFGSGIRFTKGRTSELFWILFQLSLGLAILAFIYGAFYEAVAYILGRNMRGIMALLIIYTLSWPWHFLAAWYTASIAKIYLAIRPQPEAGDNLMRN